MVFKRLCEVVSRKINYQCWCLLILLIILSVKREKNENDDLCWAVSMYYMKLPQSTSFYLFNFLHYPHLFFFEK